MTSTPRGPGGRVAPPPPAAPPPAPPARRRRRRRGRRAARRRRRAPAQDQVRRVRGERERLDVLPRLDRAGREVAQLDARRLSRVGAAAAPRAPWSAGAAAWRRSVAARAAVAGAGAAAARRRCRPGGCAGDVGGFCPGGVVVCAGFTGGGPGAPGGTAGSSAGRRRRIARTGAARAAAAAPAGRIDLIGDPLRVGREHAAGRVRHLDVLVGLEPDQVQDRLRFGGTVLVSDSP